MRRLLLLCLVFVLHQSARMYERRVSRSPCDPSWMWDNGDNCYFLDKTRFSWFQAAQHCGHLRSGLAHLSNQRTRDFIKSLLAPASTRNPSTHVQGYWLEKDIPDNSEDCPYLVAENQSKGMTSCQMRTMGYICVSKAVDLCSRIQCQQVCLVQGPNTARCLCSQGYQMDGNGQCVDIDECNDTNRCDHQCVNTPGYYNCSCYTGYTMKGDDMCTEATTSQLLAITHSSMLHIVLFTVPVVIAGVFGVIILSLRRMNRRAKESLRTQEEAAEQERGLNEMFNFDDPWLRTENVATPVEAWRAETAV